MECSKFITDHRAAALAAVLIVTLAAFGAAASAADSDATSDPTYGTATDINIAPGMRYTWTSQWPSELNPTWVHHSYFIRSASADRIIGPAF